MRNVMRSTGRFADYQTEGSIFERTPPGFRVGNRILPHTADLIIEAWAPDKIRCLEEAVQGLVGSFVSVKDVPATEPVPVGLEPSSDEGLLVGLLEEVVYVLDVLGVIPVNVALEATEDGGIAGFFDVVPIDKLEVIGPSPKGISYGDAEFIQENGSWRCKVIVDI